MFSAIVDGIVSYYKEKKKKPMPSQYEFLTRDHLLNDSSYLNFLVDNASNDEQLDAVHEHMNNFNDKIDIYSVPSYMRVSQKIIEKKSDW